MEPVVTTILQALEVGARAASTDIASDSVKSIYNNLKQLIKQKWVDKPEEPNAETVLAGYASKPKLWESMLAQKLEESGIKQDKNIYQQAKQLIQAVDSSVKSVDSSVHIRNQQRSRSPGHHVEGDWNQKTYKQTRLAALLWLLALALTGVIGLGVYLFMTGRLQLLGQPSIPGQVTNSGKPSATSERRVTQTALDSIQAGMTFAQVEERLGVHLKLYSEISYTNAYANTPLGSLYESMTNIKSVSTYSCVLEDGSLFYFAFSQTAQSDSFVLYVKSATPLDLTKPGSSN